MEQKISAVEELKNLKVGQSFLMDSPLIKDDLIVLSVIIEVYKYPIGQDNRKFYYNNNKPVYADEVGETGDEMINEYTFLSQIGDLTLNELNFTDVWNLRLIDEKHEKYNKEFIDNTMKFSKGFDKLKNMFGNL